MADTLCPVNYSLPQAETILDDIYYAASLSFSPWASFTKQSSAFPPATGSGAEIVGHRRTCWVRVFSILSFFPPLKRTCIYFGTVPGRVTDEERKIRRRINGDPASALLDMHDPQQRSGYSWTTSA